MVGTVVQKPIDPRQLQDELVAAGVAIPGIGTAGRPPYETGDKTVYTYDAEGAAADLPPAAIPVLDAHTAPPRVFDYVETQEVAARLTTTDATFREVYRLKTVAQTMYRATFSMSAIDAASFDAKDSQARLVFKRTATQLLQVGATIALGTAQDAAATSWAIAAQASGTDLVIGVRGAAGRTIDWILAGDVASFAPSGLPATG